ncbi:MAG: Rne/Rng family ribonuclease [Halobacteriovoraceae bacterium]|nr:Rne/Rng family ribonuclease [Halobacteriovoraceae bacterium]MCB9093963.1 Rne/Rng family ribonuclease [Halobacteriovoraceae bacterium]
MGKELVINETHNECRVALVENGEILDLLVDRSKGNEKKNYPNVGNIYLGRVIRVLPGMQSAFIDIGTERAAFLYVDDAYLPTLEEQREMAQKIKELQEEREQRPGKIIYDEMSTLSETVDLKYRPGVKIQDVLKEGSEIVVQVAKEPISTKGPRVTRHITIAGRHIVYMPYIEHIGVSRRIEAEEERERLREILESIRPEGKGIIARTVAEGQSYKTLKNDFGMTVKVWKEVLKKLEKAKAPNEVFRDLNFLQRALRDITDDDVDQILVDNKSAKRSIDKFVNKYLPEMKGKVNLYQEDNPIFEQYGIDLEIERALSNKVFLKSGGSINVDQTEALVSIDVNTGKFVGKKTLEETILKTNLEAVKEIAYQLRLRNCGGIIIIDFIDMEKEEHRDSVYQALLDALKRDRSKTNVLPISELGLVEMTRKRTRDTLIRTMCEPCSYCEGTGRVKSVLTVCFEVIREIMKVIKKSEQSKISVFAHPEVCARLAGEEFGIIEYAEEAHSKTLSIRADNNYHVEQYEIFANDY